MKNIISVILVIILLLLLAACVGMAGSSSESASDPSCSAPTQSGGEPESASTSYKEYPSLAQALDYFTETGLYWRFELPDMKYGREHIAVTKELQSEIYKILTEYEPQFRPDLEANEDRDCDWDYGPIFIGIDGSDDGFYTKFSALSRIPTDSYDYFWEEQQVYIPSLWQDFGSRHPHKLYPSTGKLHGRYFPM